MLEKVVEGTFGTDRLHDETVRCMRDLFVARLEIAQVFSTAQLLVCEREQGDMHLCIKITKVDISTIDSSSQPSFLNPNHSSSLLMVMMVG